MILKRTILKIARIIFLLALYCWIGNAIYRFLSSGFYPGYGGWARAYYAILDGLRAVPGTLMMIFNFLAGLVQSAYSTLVAQLGYDPLAIFRNPLPPVPQPGPSLTNPSHFIDPAIPSMMQMAVGLSIAQFVLLFLLSAFGARIGWRHPGIPIVYNIGIKLLYFAATIGIAFWLASLAFKTGIFPGVMAVLVAVLLIYIPLLSGLPLWLLVSIGLRPAFLAQMPFRLAALFFRAVRGSGGGKDGFGDAHDGQQKAGSGQNRADSGSSSSEDRYRSACDTFELQPYAFTRTQLKNRYRTLMQKVHPDARGSTRLAAILNQDYELLLQFHGWRR